MSDILSFEASSGDVFGDLVSRRPARRERPKIGLLALGYFEYWRMFSPEFKTQVLGDLQTVADHLSKGMDLVFPCVVDTMDTAEQAGQAFAAADLDALVVVEGTYTPDYMSLQAIDAVPNVPLILFTTQLAEDITPNDDYEMVMRNSALIGTSQLSGSLNKMDREYEVVVGSLEDEPAYEEIRMLAKVHKAVRDLRSLTIGVVGHVFRGMYDLENDKTKIKGALGPNIVYVELSHLVREWQKVTDQETTAASEDWLKRFTLRGTTAGELQRSCRLGVAMQRLIDRLRLDALCFLGQHYIEKETGVPARIGASMMLERGKHLVASEGDLAGLTMMHAMEWLTGNSPLQAEWGQYDAAHNALFLVGHGVASPAIAGGDAGVSITSAPEEWGFTGHGANLEFILAPGAVTIAHLLNGKDGWQMIIGGGESLPYPTLPCNEIHALVQIERPVKEFLVELQRYGVAHHCIVVHGDIRRELQALARIWGIRSLTL
ncbi:MAG: hypothetical protein Q7T82_12915 [Armatimonadota bacterium]|nr:hypothetical protein [Armatimonadota bacterium]